MKIAVECRSRILQLDDEQDGAHSVHRKLAIETKPHGIIRAPCFLSQPFRTRSIPPPKNRNGHWCSSNVGSGRLLVRAISVRVGCPTQKCAGEKDGVDPLLVQKLGKENTTLSPASIRDRAKRSTDLPLRLESVFAAPGDEEFCTWTDREAVS